LEKEDAAMWRAYFKRHEISPESVMVQGVFIFCNLEFLKGKGDKKL